MGQRLRHARIEAGYNRREDVARKLGDGYSEGSLHRWENDAVAPPFGGIAELADLYDVSLDWLSGRTPWSDAHKLTAGKVLVDQDGLERIDSLMPGEPVPDSVIGPRFHCVWTVPANLLVLGESAAKAVERRLAGRISELSSVGGRRR